MLVLTGGAALWLLLSHDKEQLASPPAPANDYVVTKPHVAPENHSPGNSTQDSSATYDHQDFTDANKPNAQSSTEFRSYEIAATAWSEEEFQAQLSLAKSDPALLSALIEEFQQEFDPYRLQRLTLLLGKFPNNPRLITAAADMIDSGIPESQEAAFELLQYLQPHSVDARALVLDALEQYENEVIIDSALTALLAPGGGSTTERQRIQQRAPTLAQHHNVRIRQRTYGVLARWAADSDATDTLLQGLSDPDENVRKTTAFAFINYPFKDQSVLEALLTMVENPSEIRSARRGALLALQSTSLSAEQASRLQAASTF